VTKATRGAFSLVIGGFALLLIAIGASNHILFTGVGLSMFVVAFAMRTGLFMGQRQVPKGIAPALYLVSAVVLAIAAITDGWPLAALAAYSTYSAWSSRQVMVGVFRRESA
jgi:hypothetical protein